MSLCFLPDEVFVPAPTATAAAQPQAAASKSLLPKASQSGLRPPGFSSSRAAAGRLAAFGFVRSSSVSSVTSAHSADSTQSDPCRAAHRKFTRYRKNQTFLLCTCYFSYSWIPVVRSQTPSVPNERAITKPPVPFMNTICIKIPHPHSLCSCFLSLPELLPSYYSRSTTTDLELQICKQHIWLPTKMRSGFGGVFWVFFFATHLASAIIILLIGQCGIQT